MKLKELDRVGRRPGSRFIYSGLVSCPTVHRHPAILTIPNILLQLHKPLFHSFDIQVLVAHAVNILLISTAWSILTCFQACAQPWMNSELERTWNWAYYRWCGWCGETWLLGSSAHLHLFIYASTYIHNSRITLGEQLCRWTICHSFAFITDIYRCALICSMFVHKCDFFYLFRPLLFWTTIRDKHLCICVFLVEYRTCAYNHCEPLFVTNTSVYVTAPPSLHNWYELSNRFNCTGFLFKKNIQFVV